MHRENMCSKFIKRKSRYTSNGLNITDQHHCLKLGKWNSDGERERDREREREYYAAFGGFQFGKESIAAKW